MVESKYTREDITNQLEASGQLPDCDYTGSGFVYDSEKFRTAKPGEKRVFKGYHFGFKIGKGDEAKGYGIVLGRIVTEKDDSPVVDVPIRGENDLRINPNSEEGLLVHADGKDTAYWEKELYEIEQQFKELGIPISKPPKGHKMVEGSKYASYNEERKTGKDYAVEDSPNPCKEVSLTRYKEKMTAAQDVGNLLRNKSGGLLPSHLSCSIDGGNGGAKHPNVRINCGDTQEAAQAVANDLKEQTGLNFVTASKKLEDGTTQHMAMLIVEDPREVTVQIGNYLEAKDKNDKLMHKLSAKTDEDLVRREETLTKSVNTPKVYPDNYDPQVLNEENPTLVKNEQVNDEQYRAQLRAANKVSSVIQDNKLPRGHSAYTSHGIQGEEHPSVYVTSETREGAEAIAEKIQNETGLKTVTHSSKLKDGSVVHAAMVVVDDAQEIEAQVSNYRENNKPQKSKEKEQALA